MSLDFDDIHEYADVCMRVCFALSPILVIGYMLCTAREDEEEEKAKLEASKNSAGCKT
jgi:hypothetical protein